MVKILYDGTEVSDQTLTKMVGGERHLLTEKEIEEINNRVLDEKSKEVRIAEIKQLLQETDYVALSDYDQDKPDIIAQRAVWRAEIRVLEE